MITKKKKLLLTSAVLVTLGLALAGAALASGWRAPEQQAANPIHPTFPLLDSNQQNVLESGEAVSTMATCGQCHDTEYIASHSFHTDLGLSSFGTGDAHEWDQSNSLFGQWNPLTYRYLSAAGDERTDLSTSGWLMFYGPRVSGGGPAVTSRTGDALPAGDPNPENWNWQESGVYEMDCFVCHLENPNNDMRISALEMGNFQWANTATLVGSGLVNVSGEEYTWNTTAFAADGEILPDSIHIQDPSSDNCAQCHGLVHTSSEPLALSGCDLENWETATTGQIISGQNISISGMNIAGKDTLGRPFDIHAERGLECTDCHYSTNNPAYYQASESPEHLAFDPRRLEIGEYLQTPNHNLAGGAVSGSMRNCDNCHNAQDTHDWLPYADQHMSALACESCHIPEVYAPAVQSYDWTVLTPDGKAVSTCRGTTGSTGTLNDLVTGYSPVLLPETNSTGGSMLTPYNLVTSWYWVYDSNNGTRPVRLEDLKYAFFGDGHEPSGYVQEIMAAFDTNGDGTLDENELILDIAEKTSAVADRLASLGLTNPRISGEIQPYAIHHSIASDEWATKDCAACHSDGSRTNMPVKLAESIPGGTLPTFTAGTDASANGEIYSEDGALYYKPSTSEADLYIFGHDRVSWIDALGGIFFVGVLGAVSVHGGLRFFSSVKKVKRKESVQKVYMYQVYERFWHWLQTFAIVLLLLTGLVIHRPDLFRLFSFPHVVVIHNILSVLLVINAAFSLFYHVVSGEIRQYLPHPYGFFDQMIVQAKYYLNGIFKGHPHPFEKSPQKKLNPLQQITYFGILNVLLPLQVISGALMWGVSKFPQVAGLFGGLPVLAPFHSLVAWLFASFIVAHVYLTTTGAQPLTSIKAMMLGWDDIEGHEAHPIEMKKSGV